MVKAKKAKAAGTVKVRMIGSVIGCPDDQRATVRGLGLRRLHQVVEREDTPMVRGMIQKIPHLVAVVGDQPILQPAEKYQYVSGCNLRTEMGKMHGTYQMEDLSSKKILEVNIPEFEMIVPFKNN